MKKQGKFSKLNVIQFNKRIKNNGVAIYYWNDLKTCLRHMKESDTKAGLKFWYHQAERNQCILEGFFMNSKEFDVFQYTLDLSLMLLHLMQQYREHLTK